MTVPSNRQAGCAALTWLLVLGACGEPAPRGQAEPCRGAGAPALELPRLELASPAVSRRNLQAWVELLASPPLAGRHAGETGARDAASLIARQMAALGLAPPRPGQGYCQGFVLLDGEDYNVVGHLGPGRPGEPPRRILVGAHYDGQGIHPAGGVYPGADDNASGVAALLEVARLAARHQPESSTDWVFAAFGAEEVGQLGARAYLAWPSIDLSRLELAIHLDMVGRPLAGAAGPAVGYLAWGGPEATTARLETTVARLEPAAARSHLEIRDLAASGDLEPTISDAEVFASRMPTLLLSTALHEDHHQVTDTPERIDYAQIERAANLVLELAGIITASP